MDQILHINYLGLRPDDG